MRILTVDIGTGTQDIFLYDTALDIENGFKLIVPSPTMMVHRQIKAATRRKEAVLLTGVTIGGGPSLWAADAHARAGLPIYATPDAARTFNDDLSAVEAMGIRVLGEDEARRLPESVRRLELCDFDFAAIERALQNFGVSLDNLAAAAVAVFDHGNAPPDVSDRKFRFDYLDERIRSQNRLSAFAYLAEHVPPSMTRMQAVVASARRTSNSSLDGVPLLVMDTAPAAVLGASYDPAVRAQERCIAANLGNMHTLAFRLGPGGIEGVFEHHTGLLDQTKLEVLLGALADGSIRNEQVFAHHGHGALVYNSEPLVLGDSSAPHPLVVTGPRRSLLAGSALRPYFAVPFGDMMITGCIGLLAAAAGLLPELHDPLSAALLGSAGRAAAPWEIENL